MLASCRTGCRHPPKSYQNPRALQAEVHSLGVHSLTRISLGCWTLLCPLNHSNLTFKHSNFTFKNPRALQAEVHSLGVHSLTRISSGCWTLLWPFNLSNLTFKLLNTRTWLSNTQSWQPGPRTWHHTPSPTFWRMMSTLLCLLIYDASSDHACVFLCVSMHLEAVCPHKKKYQRNLKWQRKSGWQHDTRLMMKIVFQETLTVKHPKILSLVPRSLYCSSNPLLILNLLLDSSTKLSGSRKVFLLYQFTRCVPTHSIIRDELLLDVIWREKEHGVD